MLHDQNKILKNYNNKKKKIKVSETRNYNKIPNTKNIPKF